MPDEGQEAGNQGAGDQGAAGQAGSAGGSATFDWGAYRGTLGDVGKEKSLDPIFSSQDVPGSLVKGYVEAQKLVGSSIRMPAKDAKPEDKKKFSDDIVAKLRKEGLIEGVPESPEKYEFAFPKDVEINQPFVESFRKAAHQMGMAPSMAKGIVDWYLQAQFDADNASQAEMHTEREGLKKEWGPLFAKKHELARRAAAKYVGDDADLVFKELPAKVGRRIVQAFATIGEALAEHDLISGDVPGGQSLEDIRKKIQTIQQDKNGPAFDASKPGHAEAKKELQTLIDTFSRLGGKWGK